MSRLFSLDHARSLDAADPLRPFRRQFIFPEATAEGPVIYFTGNSLGLQPIGTREAVMQELDDWARYGVEGHFKAATPWVSYHEALIPPLAELVGARPIEVTAMNSLTVNLHLLMVSFYRPTARRYKILIEPHAFPSDRYAVRSQLRFHGYDPDEGLIIAPADAGGRLDHAALYRLLETRGEEVALLLMGGVNYYTGQVSDMATITRKAHARGITVGFDLAHAVGNIPLALHDWGVDFAAWCSYKYLNGGPGGVAGIFIHEKHLGQHEIPRFEGWWGHDKTTRFAMPDRFAPLPTAEAWQLSNVPILLMAALRPSLELFRQAGMGRLRAKALRMWDYFHALMKAIDDPRIEVITPTEPPAHGCQISLRISRAGRKVYEALTASDVYVDWRFPDVIRAAPVPLYNSFEDVYRFADRLQHILKTV